MKRSPMPARRIPLKAGGAAAGRERVPPRRVPLRAAPGNGPSPGAPDGSRHAAGPGETVAP